MAIFLGLDCGGSRTRALAVDESGGVVHRGEGGPANLASTPEDLLEQHLRDALEGCPKPLAAVGCFAGLLTHRDQTRAFEVMSRCVTADIYDARPDYEACLAAAGPETDGVLISGTGSLIVSRNPEEGLNKTGGGGPLLDDDGSVFSLCRRTVIKTCLAAKRYEATATYWDRAHEVFGARKPEEIISAIYRRPNAVRSLCKLADVVVADALAGEDYARDSLNETFGAMAAHLDAHLRAYRPDSTNSRIALSGGMWHIDPQLFEVWMEGGCSAGGQKVDCYVLEDEPVQGAVALARSLT